MGALECTATTVRLQLDFVDFEREPPPLSSPPLPFSYTLPSYSLLPPYAPPKRATRARAPRGKTTLRVACADTEKSPQSNPAVETKRAIHPVNASERKTAPGLPLGSSAGFGQWGVLEPGWGRRWD